MTDYQLDGEILIQPYADAMGPFTFDLSNQLPSGDDIASVVVKSYLGVIDTSAELIDSTSLAANVVSIYFNYPTKLGKHKLTFEYTLVSGAKDEADFYGVLVDNV